MSNEKIKPPVIADKSLSPKLAWIYESRIRLRFTGSSLRQEFPTFTSKNVVNLFILYESDRWPQDLKAKFSLKDCLFEAVKATKNDNPNKYFYSGYGFGFDSYSLISMPSFDWGKNSIIFGGDMSSSMHPNNKNKNILILGKRQTKGLNNTSPTAEAEHSINVSRPERKFCLSLHYNGSNRFFFVNATKIYQFKVKDSEIRKYLLCLGNISKDFSVDNMKKNGLNGYLYDFSVDYKTIDTSNNIDIHKYLMKKHDIK